MLSSLFDYDLPPERIAQEPAPQRDAARLLVVHRAERRVEHRCFEDLPEYLGRDDLIFRNRARVLPARLFAERPTGGRVECLLLRPASEDALEWWCLVRPGKRLPLGARFSQPGCFEAEIVGTAEGGERRVRFALERHASVAALAEEMGKMPLPPYIAREREDARDPADRDRYQTVYAAADKSVAAAAPTAGLHFTPGIIAQLEARGARFLDLALHVGMGTFKPIEAERVADHAIHLETYEVPPEAQAALLDPRGQRRVCIGTTSARSVEDFLSRSLAASGSPFVGEADIFIYPPRAFRGVDALVTNFHQPRSTLLCLVSAFLDPGGESGIAWLKEIYAEAIRLEYRFLSYGDAMLIL